jgi:hypothetical protein
MGAAVCSRQSGSEGAMLRATAGALSHGTKTSLRKAALAASGSTQVRRLADTSQHQPSERARILASRSTGDRHPANPSALTRRRCGLGLSDIPPGLGPHDEDAAVHSSKTNSPPQSAPSAWVIQSRSRHSQAEVRSLDRGTHSHGSSRSGRPASAATTAANSAFNSRMTP